MAWGVAPEAQRPVLGAGASTSGDPGLPPEEAAVRLLRDLLAAFFQAYLEDASEVRKPQMSLLLAQAHQHGLVGARVLPALAALHDALRPELDAGPEKFAAFYHLSSSPRARDRNPRAEAATNAWAFALANGRFTLLERFCAFVKTGVCREASPRTRGARCWTSPTPRAPSRRRRTPSPRTTRGARGRAGGRVRRPPAGSVSVPNESQSFSSQSLSQSSPQSEERWRVTGCASRPRSRVSPPDAWDSAMDASARRRRGVHGRGRGRGGAGLRAVRPRGAERGWEPHGRGAAANPEWGDVAGGAGAAPRRSTGSTSRRRLWPWGASAA